MLASVDHQARSAEEFDALAYEEFEEEGAMLGYFDLGVTGLVKALNAAGCVTAFSCRGHPGSAREQHPQVLLTCDAARAELLAMLAARANCGVENFCGTGLAVYAASVSEMLQLGELVVEARDRFDALPAPERRDPGEVIGDFEADDPA